MNAKRKLLQMPIVAIRVQYSQSTTNKSEIVLTELINGINYLKVLHFLEALVAINSNLSMSAPLLSKADLTDRILSLRSRSDREREL